MIIYPPLVGNETIACTTNSITVPFGQNAAVGIDEVEGFSLQIKEYNSATALGTVTTQNEYNSKGELTTAANFKYDASTQNGTVTFDISQLSLSTGVYYKMQLGYLDEDSLDSDEDNPICYAYSIVFLTKVVEAAEAMSVNDWFDGSTNEAVRSYAGRYKSFSTTEPPYSYKFDIYLNDELIETSGEQLAKADTAVDGNYTFLFKPEVELEQYKPYTLMYTVRTVNGFEEKRTYTIIRYAEPQAKLNEKITAEVDSSQGVVFLTLNNKSGESSLLEFVRKESGTSKWEVIVEEYPLYSFMTAINYIDHTVKQGSTYTYGYREKAGDIYSAVSGTVEVSVDFEHMILEDSERSLVIKYNPKVSSFKTTILEQKQDTIGSRFPHILRNGNVAYKEIPIQGLISYLLDNEDEYFDIYSKENIAKEREYKLKLLDWLNNGKPKLFRSPQEGNYIVQITNVSLSPEDNLGRLLHNFSCTAYEIAEYSIANLREKGLFGTAEVSGEYIGNWEYKSFLANELVEAIGNGDFQNSTIRNLSWELRTLSTAEEATITLSGTKYNNYFGFSTPKDTEYTLDGLTVKEQNKDTTITFEAKENYTVDSIKSDFADSVYGYSNIFTNTVDGYNFLKIYKMQIYYETEDNTIVEDGAEEYSITFANGTKVTFQPGITYEYSNLTKDNLPVAIGDGLNVVIYAQVSNTGEIVMEDS